MSSTDRAYAATKGCAMSSTETPYPATRPIAFVPAYAMAADMGHAPLSCYARAMRCPAVQSGTETEYATTKGCAMSGTQTAYGTTKAYEMSGTEIAYATTRRYDSQRARIRCLRGHPTSSPCRLCA
eukprot:1765435-Rhodomonas_salina.4